MKKLFFYLVVLTFFLPYLSTAQNYNPSSYKLDGVELSQKEQKLYNLIMDYRKQKGLPSIPLSKSLTYVAQVHAWDVAVNKPNARSGCNMHSWSSAGSWSSCCYTKDHKQAKCMWNKPREMTNYKGNGYEISYGGGGSITAEGALKSWKSSAGHNNVIINKEIWKNSNWQSIGIAIYKGYAMVWFGKEQDDQKVTISSDNGSGTSPSLPSNNNVAGTEMQMGNSMITNQRIYSPNKQHYLVMQSDGNLVVYTKNDKPTWATDTYGKGNGCRLDMQNDGHLVIYNASNRAIWASGTHSSRNAKYAQREWKPVKMVFTNGGFVTLISTTGKVVWTSKNSKGERL
ncbi:CAP domain-containing protein [Bernardetia sp. OM2101]|uniref:CAP domain-containing protein n=1 Tax=Bernardetia sp. OM2101 TaxID=3344876 RepID=UPI0035D097EE